MRQSILAAVLLGLSSTAVAQVTINPSGGTGPGTGVRVHVGPTGQVQVIRNGTGQFYSQTATPGATTNPGVLTGLSNGVYLAIGTTNVFGPLHFAAAPVLGVTAAEFTPVSNTVTPQPNGSGSATTVLRATVGGRNYDLSVRYDYTFPNDFVSVTHTLTIPAGNTVPVRLYHALDAYLGGDDFGPSFYVQGPPTVVGGFRQASNVVLAWRYRGGLPWTGYYGGFYECMFRDALCPMGSGGGNNVFGALTFNNWVDSTVKDNGFAIMWNFGATPGTQVVSNDLTFFSYQPTLSKAFGTTAIQAGSTTTLTFTIDNVPGAPAQGNLGFQDTLPANLLLANSTFTNTCGGTVTLNTSASPNTIRLQSGALAPTVQRCTVVVNVTSSVAGAYTNGRTNISNLSVVENQVSDQILSVVQSAPIVTLNAPGIINLQNATAYPVSGTCQTIAGNVTVTVGSVITSVPCSSGTFSASPNVAGLPDSASVTVSAAQTNAAGTGTTSRPTSKDTIAPAAPAFTSPADAAFVGTTTPTVSGTAEPGTTVRVIVGGVTVCTALAQGNGVWTCTTTALSDGARTLTTTATDPAGNTSPVSPPRTVTIDTTPPAAPVINSPAQSAVVGPNPSISGTAEPFAQVTVTEGAGTVCTVSANNLGQWSCPTTFGPSMRTLSATQRDQANNAGPAAPNRTFTIANVPTVTLNAPAAITRANVSAYTLTGACTTAAGTVTVRVGALATMPPCTGGAFSTTLDVSSLADGPAISVSAAQTNVTGTGTDTRTALKDTVAPPAPAISTPSEAAVVNTSTPMISGTGEAGATLTVRRGATVVCTVTVPGNGTWSCVAATIPDGPVSVTATATDAVGNASASSPARTFTVDTAAPNPPAITNPAQGATVGLNPTLAGTAEPDATVSVTEGTLLVCSVTANATGQWSCPTTYQPGMRSITATQRDTGGNLSAPSPARTFTVAPVPTVTLDPPGPINGVNASSYAVSGQCTTTAGQVSITVGGVSGSATCTGGAFSTNVVVVSIADSASVPVVAAQTNPSGTGNDTRSTTKDTVAPSAPTFSRPMEGAVLSDASPTLTGTAEPGSTVRVTRAGMPLCTTVTPASGTWSCVAPMLGDGQIIVTATSTDPSGNVSTASMPRTFIVDTMPPPAPTLSTPAEGARVGLSPMISGTAEPNAVVTVTEGGALVCQTTATMTGAFSCPTTLGVGAHVITARQTDTAGNQGPASAPRSFTVENVPTVILGQLQVINLARAMQYEVLGFCTTGAGPVSVAVGTVTGMATCVMGQFSTRLDVRSVPDGAMVQVTASQTTAGGTGRDQRTVLKDTVPPPAPTFTTPASEVTTFTVDRPVLAGTAEPNATVTVFINGQLAGTVTADATGAWSFTPPTPLADARYTVKASATDAAGNTGPDSVIVPFSVDSTRPNPPVILTPEKDKSYDVDRPLEITGTSEPGARVTIFLDGRPTFFVVADAQGRFSATVPANVLSEGSHLVAAEALDAAGNQSVRSADVPFFMRIPTWTYAGQGLVSCASVSLPGGVAPLALALLALVSRRRRTR
ncbi:MAG: Ig-like domain-containing protein [Myxococcaceae bacterium]|nr:Ig-like domain-containing protein [Myxococcaceae bacterium]